MILDKSKQLFSSFIISPARGDVGSGLKKQTISVQVAIVNWQHLSSFRDLSFDKLLGKSEIVATSLMMFVCRPDSLLASRILLAKLKVSLSTFHAISAFWNGNHEPRQKMWPSVSGELSHSFPHCCTLFTFLYCSESKLVEKKYHLQDVFALLSSRRRQVFLLLGYFSLEQMVLSLTSLLVSFAR